MKEDILSKLESAQSDDEREWLIMQFSLEKLSPALKDVVWSAAIPHYFDIEYLNALLDSPVNDEDFLILTKLSFVESFPGHRYNIHERSLDLLRDKLWEKDQQQYKILSQKAAKYCIQQDQDNTIWRAEAFYHSLHTDQKEVVGSCINQLFAWNERNDFEKIEAFINPVSKAVLAGRITGDAAALSFFFKGLALKNYSKYVDAKECFDLSLQHAHSINIRGNLVHALGSTHLALAEYDPARVRLKEALDIYKKTKDPLGKAHCLNSLGDIYFSLDEDEKALGQFKRALKLYKDAGSLSGEAACIASIADIHIVFEKYDKALVQYKKALKMYKIIGQRLGVANCIHGLGCCYLNLEEYAKARTQLMRALDLYKNTGNMQGEANSKRSLGHFHQNLEEYDTAQMWFEKALKIYKNTGDRHSEADCIEEMGDLHLNLEEYDKARMRFEEALKIFKNIGSHRGEARCNEALEDLN